MIFTDEDLKRLRGELTDKRLLDNAPDLELEALINRLEAAERFALAQWQNADHEEVCALESDWRKAAGK